MLYFAGRADSLKFAGVGCGTGSREMQTEARKEIGMKKLFLLAFMVMMALALMAPAAFAQDDDLDDGYDDDDGAPAQVAPLPDTGGPAFLIPAAGAALLGAGAVGVGVGVVRRKKD